ncbi:MAG: DUF4198 domain-containing protein [Leptolyngbya sp. SIO4C1]|nr:DUF4198 domain-containing protein [Leptolyngbya sp. SIO4C1]
MKAQLLVSTALLTLLAVPGKALAHAVQTNYLLNGQQLEIQSTFGNGEPLKGAKVSVYSPSNPAQPWAQGTTDSQGRFEFAPDQAIAGDWEVMIRQQGHGDILTVPVGRDGVEADLISDRGGSDLHYAKAPWSLVGASAIALLVLAARTLRQAQP